MAGWLEYTPDSVGAKCRKTVLFMKVFLQCLAVAVGLTAFLPFVASKVWWIRGCEFPRMQMLALAIAVGVVVVFLGG